MSNTIVSISEQAFFTIVTAALEAYKVDHSKLEDGSEIRLETFGNLWGHETFTKSDSIVYHVTYADVSTSASREKSSVLPKDEAYELKNQFVEYLFPELKFLGDYHSHPYSKDDDVRTELDLERNELHHFSPADFKVVKEEQENGKNYRVGLVVTVFERDEQVERKDAWMDETSCVRFQYESLTIWIKSYVWAGDEFRRRTDKKVTLVCPTIGFSLREMRVADLV
ncbi:hypothetical protein QWY20_18365 [Alkalimonas sp. MEB108]|uniref:JAB domain-containing protein n=1 Tax=Alkalimonas cellulosilytica TaxID=3058395 RepID=A0ABU7JA42_9GAMM|nr:hypothetical protein [Alkalimonas sp. MEB108]MEE2003414.1 hypothetical protein [Alkalimonas sp. MEB108]